MISEINSLPRFLCFYVDNGYYLNKRKISKRLSDRIVYNFRSRNRVSIRLYKEKIRTIRWLSANNSDYTSLVLRKSWEFMRFRICSYRLIFLRPTICNRSWKPIRRLSFLFTWHRVFIPFYLSASFLDSFLLWSAMIFVEGLVFILSALCIWKKKPFHRDRSEVGKTGV